MSQANPEGAIPHTKFRNLGGRNRGCGAVGGGAEPLPACFCKAGRTAGLPATPRPGHRAAGCRTALLGSRPQGLARSLAQPSRGPAVAVGAHLPGGRASRRPWPCCCGGGSAAQTAAQVSLETPAGADQGQPGPPAKSGSGHGRPVLCGDKGSWRWGARRRVSPQPPGCGGPRGETVSALLRPRRYPGEKHPSAAGRSPLRGEAFPSRSCPSRGMLGYLSRRLPPWELPALTRVPAPGSPPPPPARWHRTAPLPPLSPEQCRPRRSTPQQRGSEQSYARTVAEFPAVPWEILRS